MVLETVREFYTYSETPVDLCSSGKDRPLYLDIDCNELVFHFFFSNVFLNDKVN